MSRRSRTRNRHARIRAKHLLMAELGPSQVYREVKPKDGYSSGTACVPSKAKKDRPLGHTFAESATRVYRHKLQTDPKAKY